MHEVAQCMCPFAGTDWFRNISEWTSGEITRLRAAASDGPTLSPVPLMRVPSTPHLLVPLVGAGPSAAAPSSAASPPIEDGPSLFGGRVSSSAPPSVVPPTCAPTPAVVCPSPAVVDEVPQSLSAGAPVDVAAVADPEIVIIKDLAVDVIVVDEPAYTAEDGSPAAVLFQHPPSLVTLQRALLSDLDKGTSYNGKDASAPRCLARPGNAATSDEWRLSPNGWKDEQRMEDGLK